MKLIGLAYKKGVGKDTLGGFMQTQLRCEHPGMKVKHVSFAAKLKDICFQLYGWAGLERGVYYESHRELKEVVLPLIEISPRQIWIEVGNYLRKVYEATWIDYALHSVKADVIIITDVRFQNEALAIKAAGGNLIRIDRAGIPQGTDPAETELDRWLAWDYLLDNNGTLRELNEEGIKLLAKIM